MGKQVFNGDETYLCAMRDCARFWGLQKELGGGFKGQGKIRVGVPRIAAKNLIYQLQYLRVNDIAVI